MSLDHSCTNVATRMVEAQGDHSWWPRQSRSWPWGKYRWEPGPYQAGILAKGRAVRTDRSGEGRDTWGTSLICNAGSRSHCVTRPGDNPGSRIDTVTRCDNYNVDYTNTNKDSCYWSRCINCGMRWRRKTFPTTWSKSCTISFMPLPNKKTSV
jgi:hypothetical protein